MNEPAYQLLKADDPTRWPTYYVLELTTTQLCNMGCSYCFEDSLPGCKTKGSKSKVNMDSVFSAIDDILSSDEFEKKFAGRLQIGLWGGEPTLNPTMIYQLVSRYVDNVNVRFMMYTNGLSMAVYLKLFDMFDEVDAVNRLHLQFSYDGRGIHEEHRVMHDGASTAERVINNFRELVYLRMRVSLKPTLPVTSFGKLNEAWDSYRELEEEFREYTDDGNGPYVVYAPTIDYSSVDNKDVDLKLFAEQIDEICTKEFEHWKEHDQHIMGWFYEYKVPVRCSAGTANTTIDVNGDHIVCHGCMYGNDADGDTKIGHIDDDDFLDNLFKTSEQFRVILESEYDKVDPACATCPATHCCQCNAVKYAHSDKETIAEKWIDYTNQSNLCAIYRIFGLKHRGLNKRKKEYTEESNNG